MEAEIEGVTLVYVTEKNELATCWFSSLAHPELPEYLDRIKGGRRQFTLVRGGLHHIPVKYMIGGK